MKYRGGRGKIEGRVVMVGTGSGGGGVGGGGMRGRLPDGAENDKTR